MLEASVDINTLSLHPSLFESRVLMDSLVLRERLETMVLREMLVPPELLDPLVPLDLRLVNVHNHTPLQFFLNAVI